MTIFLIVLVAILVICCCVMLYLYFSVRKEADHYEYEYEKYSELYSEYHESYKEYYKKYSDVKYECDRLECDIMDKGARIKQLEASFNDHTINIRTFGTRTNFFSGSIDIPAELRNPENSFDPFDAKIINADMRRKLVKMLGEEALKHTGFRMEYDLHGHVYSLIYICPMCVDNKYVNEGEAKYLDMDAEMPMLDMIQKLFKQEEQE